MSVNVRGCPGAPARPTVPFVRNFSTEDELKGPETRRVRATGSRCGLSSIPHALARGAGSPEIRSDSKGTVPRSDEAARQDGLRPTASKCALAASIRGVALDQSRGADGGVKAPFQTPGPERPQGRGSGTLDPEDLRVDELSVAHLLEQLFGQVEIRGGEADGVASELAGLVQATDKRLDLLGQAPVASDIHQGRVAADAGRHDRSIRPSDSPRLTQRDQTIIAVEQVVERTEEQHGFLAGVRLGQSACVTELSRDTRHHLSPRDVRFDGVDDVDFVALGRQPLSVDTGRATDIQDRGRRRREKAGDQLLGPDALQEAMSPHAKPFIFVEAVTVEREDLRLDWRHQRWTLLPHRPSARVESRGRDELTPVADGASKGLADLGRQ